MKKYATRATDLLILSVGKNSSAVSTIATVGPSMQLVETFVYRTSVGDRALPAARKLQINIARHTTRAM